MTTLCAIHTAVPAVQACDRCGSFACDACLSFAGDQRLCAPCVARAGSLLPSLQGRATWARLGLYAMGALHLCLGLLDLIGAGEGNGLSVGAVLLGLTGLAFFPAFILTIVFFCRWFHLSVRCATSRGVTLSQTPAGAVGSWFIPFLNLVRPFDLMRQMLRGTGGDATKVGAWQALWIGGNVFSNVSSRLEVPVVTLIAGLLLLGAALTGVGVINELTRSATSASET